MVVLANAPGSTTVLATLPDLGVRLRGGQRAVAGDLLGEVPVRVVRVLLQYVVPGGAVGVVEILQHQPAQQVVAVVLVLQPAPHRVGVAGHPAGEVVRVGVQHQVVAGGRAAIAGVRAQPDLGHLVAGGVRVVVAVTVGVHHRRPVPEAVVAVAGLVALRVGDPDRPVVLVVLPGAGPRHIAADLVDHVDLDHVAVGVVPGEGLLLMPVAGDRVGGGRLGGADRPRAGVVAVGGGQPVGEAVGDLGVGDRRGPTRRTCR